MISFYVVVLPIFDALKPKQPRRPSKAVSTVVEMAEVVERSAMDEPEGSEEGPQPTVA